MPRFRRITPQQRLALDGLEKLGQLAITPQNAKPLRNLKRRGLVQFKRDAQGDRYAVRRPNAQQRRIALRNRITMELWDYLHADLPTEEEPDAQPR